MKKILTFLGCFVVMFVLSANVMFGQACDATSSISNPTGVVDTDGNFVVYSDGSNQSAYVQSNPPTGSLPDNEYIVEAITNAGADTIIVDINADGSFDAVALGLVTGDIVNVYSFTYDLAAINGVLETAYGLCPTLDVLLPDVSPPPCSAIVPLYEGGGLENLEDALMLATSFGSDIVSAESAVSTLNSLNETIVLLNLEICFGYSGGTEAGATPVGYSIMVTDAPAAIVGCMDMAACNYDPEATEAGDCDFAVEFYDCDGVCLTDTDADGVCDELEVLGCTDATATNFNPDATEDSGDCQYETVDCAEGETEYVFTIAATASDWPTEISWSITDADGNELAGVGCGAYDGSSDGVVTLCLTDGVEYTFTALDDFGDGWNNGTFSITQGGGLVYSSEADNGTSGDDTYDCVGDDIEEAYSFVAGETTTLVCGDGVCDAGETYETCPEDCPCLFDVDLVDIVNTITTNDLNAATLCSDDPVLEGGEAGAIVVGFGTLAFGDTETFTTTVSAGTATGSVPGSTIGTITITPEELAGAGETITLTLTQDSNADCTGVIEISTAALLAAATDESACSGFEGTEPVLGCTDPTATNYDPLATEDSGDCQYETGDCAEGETEYVLSIDLLGGGTDTYPGEVSWELVDADGNILASVACGDLAGLAGVQDDAAFCLTNGVEYTFNAFDDWGDGWNNSTFTITEGGALVYSSSPSNGAAGDDADDCVASELEEAYSFVAGETTTLVCGDGVCDAGETYETCPDDCPCLFDVDLVDIVNLVTTEDVNEATLCSDDPAVGGEAGAIVIGFGTLSFPNTETFTTTVSAGATAGSVPGTTVGTITITPEDLAGAGEMITLTLTQDSNTDCTGTVEISTAAILAAATDESACSGFGNTEPVLGCTDPTATNYDPLATEDDGSCEFAPACDAQSGVLTVAGSDIADEQVFASCTTVMASTAGNNTMDGYTTLFVVTQGDELTVIDANDSGEFTGLAGGDYSVHVLNFEDANAPTLPAVGESATVLFDNVDACLDLNNGNDPTAYTAITVLNPITITSEHNCDEITDGVFQEIITITGGLPQYDDTYTYVGSGDINFPVLDFAGAQNIVIDYTDNAQVTIIAEDATSCDAFTYQPEHPPCVKLVTAVELLYIRGEATEVGNLISWSTATEIDNDFFTVKSSKDGINFETIATINGAGTISTPRAYSFLDEAATSGVTFYVLTATDYNGVVDTYDVIEVSRTANGFTVNNVNPTPAVDVVTINFDTNISDVVNYEIFDLTGKSVQTGSFDNVISGNNEETISVNDLTTGVYLLNINNGVEAFTVKIVKK